jgi:MYXO-CTERM domain-containing protein
LCVAAPARAFDVASQFFSPAGVADTATLGASAQGVYFTGAPRWSGLDCSSCHVGGPQKVTLRIGSDDPTLFTSGYEPGHTYELEVSIGNETEGLEYNTPTCTDVPETPGQYPYVQCNNNNFGLEIDNEVQGALTGANVFCASAPQGGSCPAPNANVDEVVVAPGGDAVFANQPHSTTTTYEVLHNDPTSWHLWWTAPGPSGPLTLYAAAVDGNGGAGTVADDQDPYGDDTVGLSVSLKQAGSSTQLGAHAGCAMVSSSSAMGDVLLLLVALVAVARRRRAVRV